MSTWCWVISPFYDFCSCYDVVTRWMSLLSLSHYYNYVIVCIFTSVLLHNVCFFRWCRVCVCVCKNSYNALNDIERIKIEEWRVVRGSGGRYASLRMTPTWLSQPATKLPVKLNWQIFKHRRTGTICGWIAVSRARWSSTTVGTGVGVYQSRRHCQESHAANCLKVLGVNIASDFSVSQHIQRLVTTNAQTVYAGLRVLRSRGLSDTALRHVYRSTVIARLMYAASVWRGFASTSDRQRINSLIDRARRNGYCASDLPSFELELCDDDVDYELFNKAVRMPYSHVLHYLLPPLSNASQKYNLRKRTHVLQLPEHTTLLSDKNFITGMLYKNAY